MNTGNSIRSRNRRVAARVALSAGLLASIAGVYAFRSLTARPGEGALRLIPANALAVASIDLTPSASQTLAFKRIDDALSRNGMDGLQKSILDMFESGASGVDELRPLILRSGAAAALPGPDGSSEKATGVVILALSDGKAAQAILAKNGGDRYFKGVRYYRLKNGHSNMMVVDDLLLVGETPEALMAVRQVQQGGAPSIANDQAFLGARSHVADDANIMLFASPAMLNDVSKSAGPAKTLDGMAKDWMSTGIAIRDGGIGISYSGAIDTQRNPEFARLGNTISLRPDLFHVLPAGAYGAFAFSDLTNYFDSLRPTLTKDKDAAKSIAEMEDSLQKEVGLDFEKDVLPAFKGNIVTAAYPGPGGAGVDALIVMDDSNDANPANAAERFQSWVRRQMEKEGNQQGPLWTERSAGNVRFFKLTDKNEADMRKSMGQGMDESSLNKQALVGAKTVAWAIVGKAVFASTSQELLDRAVANYQTPNAGLDTDPKFASHEKEVLDGSQEVFVFSLSRIAEGVRKTVKTDKMDGDSRKIFDSVVAAFEKLEDPLTLRARIQPDGRISGGVFIPLDYDKVLDFAGDMTKMSKK